MGLLIKNAIIVNADKTGQAPQDILCDGGKIARIAAGIAAGGHETIDAAGKKVLPGLIDIHTHLRQPGREDKETIETGSRAAVKGGFTSIMCMPNTNPVIDNAMVVEFIIREADRVGLCNVYPIGAVTKAQKDEELTDMAELKSAGCLAFSDDGKSVLNSRLFRLAMEYAMMLDVLIIEHCQDPLLTAGGVMNEGIVSTKIGLKGDPGIAETVTVARDIEIARYLGARVHLAHMSLKRSCELIRFAKSQGIKVTAEACPHHFTLTDEACSGFDASTKVNPPLRTQEDVDAIKEAIADGTIDCIVTDHAPHTKEDKEVGFDGAPFGLIGLETSLSLTMTELVKPGIISLNQMADKMSAAPARLVGLTGKGAVRQGYDADLTIIDPDKEWTVTREGFVSKSKNSPFIGRKLKGSVEYTICGGRVVYKI
ncbi:MAG: dihydroorotase [Candidatus Omnitrophica bacterium]|nr:dihydroorotase [Candidatus Omnitrophota bacterium]MDE2215422.1 dihydroorotase [Candidatus Omnitrophota bacterium]